MESEMQRGGAAEDATKTDATKTDATKTDAAKTDTTETPPPDPPPPMTEHKTSNKDFKKYLAEADVSSEDPKAILDGNKYEVKRKVSTLKTALQLEKRAVESDKVGLGNYVAKFNSNLEQQLNLSKEGGKAEPFSQLKPRLGLKPSSFWHLSLANEEESFLTQLDDLRIFKDKGQEIKLLKECADLKSDDATLLKDAQKNADYKGFQTTFIGDLQAIIDKPELGQQLVNHLPIDHVYKFTTHATQPVTPAAISAPLHLDPPNKPVLRGLFPFKQSDFKPLIESGELIPDFTDKGSLSEERIHIAGIDYYLTEEAATAAGGVPPLPKVLSTSVRGDIAPFSVKFRKLRDKEISEDELCKILQLESKTKELIKIVGDWKGYTSAIPNQRSNYLTPLCKFIEDRLGGRFVKIREGWKLTIEPKELLNKLRKWDEVRKWWDWLTHSVAVPPDDGALCLYDIEFQVLERGFGKVGGAWALAVAGMAVPPAVVAPARSAGVESFNEYCNAAQTAAAHPPAAAGGAAAVALAGGDIAAPLADTTGIQQLLGQDNPHVQKDNAIYTKLKELLPHFYECAILLENLDTIAAFDEDIKALNSGNSGPMKGAKELTDRLKKNLNNEQYEEYPSSKYQDLLDRMYNREWSGEDHTKKKCCSTDAGAGVDAGVPIAVHYFYDVVCSQNAESVSRGTGNTDFPEAWRAPNAPTGTVWNNANPSKKHMTDLAAVSVVTPIRHLVYKNKITELAKTYYPRKSYYDSAKKILQPHLDNWEDRYDKLQADKRTSDKEAKEDITGEKVVSGEEVTPGEQVSGEGVTPEVQVSGEGVIPSSQTETGEEPAIGEGGVSPVHIPPDSQKTGISTDKELSVTSEEVDKLSSELKSLKENKQISEAKIKGLSEELRQYKTERHGFETEDRQMKISEYKRVRDKHRLEKDMITIKSKQMKSLLVFMQKESEKLKFEAREVDISRKRANDEKMIRMRSKMTDISKRQYETETQMKLSDRDKELEDLRKKVQKYEKMARAHDITGKRGELKGKPVEVPPIFTRKSKPKTERKPVRKKKRHNKRSQGKKRQDKSPLKEFKKSIKKNLGIMI